MAIGAGHGIPMDYDPDLRSFVQALAGKDPSVFTLDYTQMSPRIYVGSVPITDADMDFLKREGFTCIIDLCRDNEHEPAMAEERGIEYKVCFAHDQHAHTVEQLKAITKFISERDKRGEKLYIHCHAGLGRSPTVMIAYFISLGIPLNVALHDVEYKRKTNFINGEHREKLRQFEAVVKSGR
jgi:atypical dual specificity phosphatase